MLTEKSAAPRLNKDKILDVARRHFARYGYRKSSLSEIAAELGVVKGALYYHVPGGKRELLESVMGREDERMLAAMIAASDAETDPRRALVAAIEAKLKTLRELKDLLGVRREVGEELVTILTTREREFTRCEFELFSAILERGEVAGVFRAIRPRNAAVAAIQATCQALEVPEVYAEHRTDEPRLFDAVFDLVLLGLDKR